MYFVNTFVIALILGFIITLICYNVFSIYAVFKNIEEVMKDYNELQSNNPDVAEFRVALTVAKWYTDMEHEKLRKKILSFFKFKK